MRGTSWSLHVSSRYFPRQNGEFPTSIHSKGPLQFGKFHLVLPVSRMADGESLIMAAESSYPALARPVAVVSPAFCVPNVVDLTIVRKLIALTDGNFLVTDVNGNAIFKVRGAHFSFHDRRVLFDATGRPVATLRQKVSRLLPKRQPSPIHCSLFTLTLTMLLVASDDHSIATFL